MGREKHYCQTADRSAINYQEKKANQNHENLPVFHLIYICTFFNYEETKMIHKNPFNTSIKVRVKKLQRWVKINQLNYYLQ